MRSTCLALAGQSGPEGNRTPHLFYAIEALYQMSYRPKTKSIVLENVSISNLLKYLHGSHPRLPGLPQ
jgi:hypothetical protein